MKGMRMKAFQGTKHRLDNPATPYFLIVPSLLLIVLFKAYPIVYSILGSFFFRGAGGISRFAGLKNYRLLFHDSVFLNSIWVTFKFNLIVTPLQVVLSLALALLLNRNMRLVRGARTLIYVPVAINMVVASTIWNMLLNPSQGPVNSILALLGIGAQPFLTDKGQALMVIILICCWKGVAYWMVFLLAGLQNINLSLYEAARIDGANRLKELFSITIPLMKNALKFVIVSDTMINLFMFVPVYMLTGGGPEGSTDTLMFEAYRAAFKFANNGRSFAIVTILLIVTFAIIGVQFLLFRDEE